MKVALLNTVCSGSTGKICCGLARRLNAAGHTARIFYGRGGAPGDVSEMRIEGSLAVDLHVLRARLFDRAGFGSLRATQTLVKELAAFDPDVIHLHNLHGYWLQLPTITAYLAACNKPVLWTLHDCWSFTGHCAYFDAAGCARWQTGCGGCPAQSAYPRSVLFDQSARNFADKKRMFTAIPNLTLAMPSAWLKNLAAQSFFGQTPAVVLPNGVDMSVFCPTPSELRAQYGLTGKRVLLGVANVWEARKGLETFFELQKRIGKNDRIVLIGLSDQQLRSLPKGILGVTRTANARALAAWYTLADVLVDATREENYPTTHLEALCCGTPVATFAAGGSAEMLTPLTGKSAPVGDVDGLLQALDAASACRAEDCLAQAAQFDEKLRFGAYIALYERLIKGERV